MGQYYKQSIKILDYAEYSDRKVNDCDYIGAKLLEHSYFGNCLMDSVAGLLHNYEMKLAWIGDYAEVDEVKSITKGEASYLDCWGGVDDNGNDVEDKCDLTFDKCDFDYSKKFLVNLDKKEYISFDDYITKANDEWAINPISILTAIGNGRGGGDYCGTNMAYVGTWAWNIITIDDEEPKGMKKLDITFVEGPEKEYE